MKHEIKKEEVKAKKEEKPKAGNDNSKKQTQKSMFPKKDDKMQQ